MPNTIDTAAVKHVAPLVIFAWGDASVARYIRWEEDVTANSVTFTAAPELDLSCDKQHGGVKDSPWSVSLKPRSPLVNMVRIWPHAPVRVTIGEVDPFDVTTYRELFYGTITRTKKKRGLVTADVVGHKANFTFPLGVIVDVTCSHIFGGPGCGVDVAAEQETGTIDAIAGNIVTINDVANLDSTRWHRGDARLDGLSIMIMSSTATTLKLSRPPPPEWNGAAVLLTPGCDKSLNICRGIWQNESRFLGLGIALPNFHPLIDGH